jgi:hypothetical protein
LPSIAAEDPRFRAFSDRLTATAVASLKTKGLHPDGGGLYVRVTGRLVSATTDLANMGWNMG